jgi:elongation factor G
MKKYETKDLRDVVLLGHGKSGKTSLAESLIFDSKVVSRMGKVDDGTSNFDTEPEEIKRKGSIHCAIGYCEWKKMKVNLLDTPGDGNFAPDAEMGTSVADAAVVVVSAPDGVQVGTERVWDLTTRQKLPRVIFINKLDRERADFDRTVEDVKKALSDKAFPLQIPIGKESSFLGVVDLLAMKAYTFEDEGRGTKAQDISADLKDEAKAAREALVEGIASTKDELIEKYLDSGELSDEEITSALAEAIRAGTIVPILCGSATKNIGVPLLLDFIVSFLPSPAESPAAKGKDPKGVDVERKVDAAEPFSARVFKTITADIGKMSLLRVVSGTVKPDSTILNTTKDAKERVGQIYALLGKKRENLSEVVAGDIVALAKLKDTKTGHTLSEERLPIVYPMPVLPEPVISFSIRPKAKGDEEKVASKLNELLEEDLSLKLTRDQLSKEILLGGMGQIHIETVVEKLRRLGVDVELAEPKVPYKETIKGKAIDVEGKHKKQTGGRGQFGVCYIDMEPKPKDAEPPPEGETEDPLDFVNGIFGGSIPRQFIPAIEKGIRDRMTRGVIAGYPVVNIRVTLKDGKHHPVDSDGRSFEMAGSKGFQAAFKAANPILLEPIVTLETVCPEEFMGDIIGDVSSRRGKVMGTDAKGRNQVIKAQVPLAEVLRYAVDLESLTGGRGSFSISFSHYEEVPSNLFEKIVAGAKVEEEED